MRKLTSLIILFVLASASYGQDNRRLLPITGWKYPNGLPNSAFPSSVTAKDTCSNTADTLWIGIRGVGGLAPVAVTVAVTTTDADLDATPDSIQIAWAAGIGGQYATVGVLDTIGITTHVRTFVFNTTGASTANNLQGSVWPYCDAIRMRILDASPVTNDSIAYTVKIMGIYEDDRIMQRLPITYPNKRTDADSTLSNNLDSVYVSAIGKGNLAPLGIGITVTTTDADVISTPDSTQALYAGGIGGFFTDIVSSTYVNELVALGTYIRSFIINTTGAAIATNTQADVAPIMDGLWIRLKSPSNTLDTVKYVIKALGIYKRGRIAEPIHITYPNKSYSADSVLGTTVDSVYVGPVVKGDLAPVGIGISYKATDADVSNFADSLLVLYSAGVVGKYANIVSSAYQQAAAPLTNGGSVTGMRTFIFNTTGAASAKNTQATLTPHFQDLWLRLKADDAGDTTKYQIRALGIYQKR